MHVKDEDEDEDDNDDDDDVKGEDDNVADEDVEDDEVEDDEVQDDDIEDDVKGEEDDDVENDDVEEEEDDDVEDDDVEEDRAQDGRASLQLTCTWAKHKRHFMRAFTGKNAAPQACAARFVRACAVEMHMDMSQEPFYAEIYWKNAAPQKLGANLCEPAQSRCTWTFHR